MLANILLSIVSFCTFVSYLPQAIEIIKTKRSNDVSITSWIFWVVSSLCYSLYAILCTDELMLVLQTTLELTFCVLILVLSIVYNRRDGEK